jgi:hypothetical protein
MADYDVLILGSGPMSLVEASLRARQGKRVCIFEASDRIGGAWAPIDCFGLKNIEASPHVFMPDKTGLRVLKRYLPYEYETLEIQPRLIIRGSKIFGDIKCIEQRQRGLEALILTTIDKFEKGTGNAFSRAWQTLTYASYMARYRRENGQTHRLIYPKRGLHAWLESCYKYLTSLGVDIRLKTKVDQIHINRHDLTFVDGSGQIVSAKKLCYSDQMIISQVTWNGENIPLSYYDDTSDHVVFIAEGPFPDRPLGFVRLMKDNRLKFINDTTEYSEDFRRTHPNRRLINIRIASSRSFTPSSIDEFFSHIAYLGYMPEEVKYIDYHHTYLHRKKLTAEMRRRLKSIFSEKAYELVYGAAGLMSGLSKTYGWRIKKQAAKKKQRKTKGVLSATAPAEIPQPSV